MPKFDSFSVVDENPVSVKDDVCGEGVTVVTIELSDSEDSDGTLEAVSDSYGITTIELSDSEDSDGTLEELRDSHGILVEPPQFRRPSTQLYEDVGIKLQSRLYELETYPASKLDLLWFPSGIVLGCGMSALGYSMFEFGDPDDLSSWWYCMVPCSTFWVFLLSSWIYTCVHKFVMEPRHLGDTAYRFPVARAIGLTITASMIAVAGWTAISFSIVPIYKMIFQGFYPCCVAAIFVVMSAPWVLPVNEIVSTKRRVYVSLFCLNMLIFAITNWMALLVVIYVRDLTEEPIFRLLSMLPMLLIEYPFEKLWGYLAERASTKEQMLAHESWICFLIVAHSASFQAVALSSCNEVYIVVLIGIAAVIPPMLDLPFVLGATDEPSAWKYWCGGQNRGDIKATEPADPMVEAKLRTASSLRQSNLTRKRKFTILNQTRERRLLALFTNVYTTLVISIGYALVFTVCYFGQNAKYMGGLKATVFHYTAEPIGPFWVSCSIFISIDALSLIFIVFLYRYYSQRNVGLSPVQLIAFMGEVYGPNILLYISWLLYHQMCITIVHCGMDFTLIQRLSS